jgi:hypothetical protein
MYCKKTSFWVWQLWAMNISSIKWFHRLFRDIAAKFWESSKITDLAVLISSKSSKADAQNLISSGTTQLGPW